jgi:hypothetical protein
MVFGRQVCRSARNSAAQRSGAGRVLPSQRSVPEQVAAWRAACQTANANAAEQAREQRHQSKEDKQRIRQLEKELQRKEKALAEAAALLILRKKAQAIWGDKEDD